MVDVTIQQGQTTCMEPFECMSQAVAACIPRHCPCMSAPAVGVQPEWTVYWLGHPSSCCCCCCCKDCKNADSGCDSILDGEAVWPSAGRFNPDRPYSVNGPTQIIQTSSSSFRGAGTPTGLGHGAIPYSTGAVNNPPESPPTSSSGR